MEFEDDIIVSPAVTRNCEHCGEPIGGGRFVATVLSDGRRVFYHVNLIRDCYNEHLKEKRRAQT